MTVRMKSRAPQQPDKENLRAGPTPVSKSIRARQKELMGKAYARKLDSKGQTGKSMGRLIPASTK